MSEKALPSISSLGEVAMPIEPDLHTDTLTIPVKLCNLPPLNSIALQVMSLTADEDIDLQRIASVVEGDPAFAAEVLFLANSSLFGFPSRMHILRHAVAVLGLDRIKALAVTVAMRAFVGASSPLVRQCWRHSAACAVVAENLAGMFEVSRDRAYTAALMHDIGRLGLLKSYARDVAPVLTREYTESAEVLAAERVAVNVDHGLAGAWLVKTWSFPPPFLEVCEHHHDPLQASDSALLQLVKIACRMADTLGYSAVRCKAMPSYDDRLLELPAQLKRDQFPTEDQLRSHTEMRLAVFEH